MFKFKIISLLAAVLLIVTSCADENALPIVTFDSAGKGAYPRLISETEKFINLFDIAGSSYTYTVEFVDQNRGADVAEYILEMTYENNNGGASVGPIEYQRWSAGEFSANANGYQEAPTVNLTASDIISKAGISAGDIKAGDNFKFEGKVVLNDGSTFAQGNSSSTVYGAAFRGHFNFTLPCGCPSSLAGTYAYSSTDLACPAGAASTTKDGEVELIALGGGVYRFNDWSFGGYSQCYGAASVAGSESLTFKDVCAEVSFTGFTDQFGDTWTYVSSLSADKTEWTIEYSNTYSESGKTVITNASGWDFELVQ